MSARDPRTDVLVRDRWDAMSETLRAVVRGLDVPAPVATSLRAVIDLHVAWEKREQVFDPGYSHDAIHGIGCRMCDHMPNLVRNPDATPWCLTVEALRVALIDGDTSFHALAADQADQAAAWHEGYQASNTNRERFDAWMAHGGSSSGRPADLLTCPYGDGNTP
jgi:hypothetical protein